MISSVSRLVVAGLISISGFAAVSVSTTSTQAILVYTAPTSAACTVAVSEFSSLSPLVADVNPALFSGSNLDTRSGVVSNGLQRIFVVGKHGMNASGSSNPFLGTDGKRHSRALQAGTTHFYRITCGTTTMTGSFTTSAIPAGSTYPEPMPVDATHPGAYNWPDLTETDRTEKTVDPVTGAPIRKVTATNDTAPYGVSWPDSGAFQVCSHVPVSSGGASYYLCAIPGTYTATLVSINTATGDAQALTTVVVPYMAFGNQAVTNCPTVVFDSADGTRFYCVSGPTVYSGKWTGTLAAGGNFQEYTPDPALSWTQLTPAAFNLYTLLAGFDTSFNAAQKQVFVYWQAVSVQQGKLVMKLWPKQNASGWIVVFDPGNQQPLGSGGTGKIIAALPIWKAPGSRWCGMHQAFPAGDQNGWVTLVPNDLAGGGYMGGPYRVVVSGPTGGPIASSDTVFTIQGQDGVFEPLIPGTNGYLMDAQPGDLFFLDKNGDGVYNYGVDEYIELASKTAPNQWTVRRASGMAASPFYLNSGLTLFSEPALTVPAGTTMYAACRVDTLAHEASGTFWWDFTNDPHGSRLVYPADSGAVSPETIEQTNTGGHSVTRNDQNTMASWGCFSASSCWTGWTQTGGVPGVSTYNPSRSTTAWPAFHGVTADPSNAYQMHPSHEQVKAPTSQQSWFLDRMPFVALGKQSTAELLAGTIGVYAVTGVTLHRDTLPTQATCGVNLLRDISSTATGTQISDAAPYTYCVARKAGECVAGSAAENIYVSCPAANYRYGGDPVSTVRCATNVLASASTMDICVTDATAYGQSVVQGGYTQTLPNGDLNRVVTQAFSRYHEPNSLYDTAYATPDGNWAMFASTATGNIQAYMAKMPLAATTTPLTRRDDYLPITVALHPSLAGVNNAILEFGYLENGASTDYFCTSRREACYAGVSGTAPFVWAIDGVVGQPCASGCSIQLPLIPGRVAYYQAIYRNAANGVVAFGEAGVAGESGAAVVTSLPVTVSPLTASASAGQTVQFTFSDATGPVAANWSVSPAIGTISTAGLYTAPASIAASQTVTITATDRNNAAHVASAVLTLNAPVVFAAQQVSPLIRVNAGGGAYTDTAGRTWAADTSYIGGYPWSVAAVAGVDAEYQTVRYGTFGYNFTVPNGSYTVVLKFAEVSYNTPGAREFNVAVNNTPVLTDFDIISVSGGRMVPVDKAFPVAVTNGQISIQFSAVAGDPPAVNAIEILPFTVSSPATTVVAGKTLQFTASGPVNWSVLPAGSGSIDASGLFTAPATVPSSAIQVVATSLFDGTASIATAVTITPAAFNALAAPVVRINAGGPAFTDVSGNLWLADTDFAGGQPWVTASPISRNANDAMYQAVRYGNWFTYTIPVANGTHTVTLDFAEVSQATAGTRQFNVAINGVAVLINFDIFAAAGGALKPIQKSFTVNVTGGSIAIVFTSGAANSPAVNGVEIY